MMAEKLISVLDIAREQGRQKQYIFKLINRLKLQTTKKKSKESKGQKISYISISDYKILKKELSLKIPKADVAARENLPNGVFYLIQLEPKFDPGRFKLGFATDINERIRSHRTAAPLLRLIKTWPCKPLWEKTAIEAVVHGCEKLYTEVFRASSIDEIQQRCDNFFKVMHNA